MHLTDNRLFNFGDSVYQAIERSAGLAIEVNPDEMGAYYVNKLFDEVEGAKLREILNEKDFKKYSAALAKKFKKPASEITTNDIVTEKNKWLNEYFEKGEMPTFVDAYLYNIARRQGKWVGGVEDITDQAGLLDNLVDRSDIDFLLAGDSSYIKTASNRMMEHMVELYTNQDLGGIEAMSSAESPEYKDALLIKRNVKMTRRIDSLTALRNMFIAIGAAHLPGDSGVIHLLQQRGFTVEPVFSSQKINAKNYVFKEVRLPWKETEDPQGLYKVSMPGNPVNLKLYGLIEMKYLFDVYNLSNYCTMAVVNPRTAGKVNKDSMLLELAQRMFHTEKKLTAKKVINNGIEGNEYQQVHKGENVRLQAYMYENVVYVAFIYAIKETTLTSEDANNFFSSFNITKTLPTAAGNRLFTDSVMGIRFTAPAEITYNKKLSTDNAGWHVSGFTGTDLSNGMYIILFSKDIQPGHFLVNDSIVQNELIANIKGQYKELHIDSLNLQGHKGIHLQGAHKDQDGIYMQAVSLIKNNRNIVLLVITDSAHLQAPEAKKIFSTLSFIPPPVVPWKIYTTADSLFSARVPGAFRIYGTEENSFMYSFDTTTASSYYIMPDTLSKYAWYKNDSLFWHAMKDRYVGLDSLEKETDLLYDDVPAKELLIKEDFNYKRMRLVRHDDKVYEVMISGDKDFVNNSDATAFLTSFKIHAPQKNRNFITQSKAALLLQDVASKDSLVRTLAVRLFRDAEFDKQDVPVLHQALLKQYQSPYTDTTSDDINMQIAAELGRLKDTTTITFIKDEYPSFRNEKEFLKNPALATLANMHTQESYTAIAQLLEQYGPPADGISYESMAAYRDSLSLVVPIFSTIQKLAKDSAHCTWVAELALTLRDSGYIKQEQIALAQNDYILSARKQLSAFKKVDYINYVSELIQVIGSFNTTAGNTVLKNYLTVKDLDVKKDAAIQLIKNKQPVPAPVLLKLAADAGIRTSLYTELKDLKKTALFPKQYATPQAFGESAVYEVASDENAVKKITFLTTKTATYKGKSYTFYLYRVVLEDDEPAGYLGIAGGYKPGSTSLFTTEDLSDIYWHETYSAIRINVFFKTFLKNMEKRSERD
jgi:uncharacterized protein YbaP (TraB family)